MQHVGAPAELLQDRVVRDGTEFARMTDRGRPPGIGLPRAGAGARGVKQRRTERPQQGSIAGVLDQLLHGVAGRREEPRSEVAFAVDRVGLGRRRLERVLGHPGDRRQGKLRRAEQQVTVATLEAAFLADAQRTIR